LISGQRSSRRLAFTLTNLIDLVESRRIIGVDFTSAPTRRKPITVALGRLTGDATAVEFDRLQCCESFAEFETLLCAGPWVGGFDLPFGFPRALLIELGWPQQPVDERSAWEVMVVHTQSLSRVQMVAAFKAYCDARPVGQKFAHRATDIPAQSSSSMKWVNPPVAFMLHAGTPILLRSGASLPGMHQGFRADRIALEAYPALLARSVSRASYKSDDKKKQTLERGQVRAEIVSALIMGAHRYDLAVRLEAAQREMLIADGSGDSLDAVLCLVQAAWGLRANRAGATRYGLPEEIDPIEGWIVGA
jgi:Protein of unknown function (DUF429)